MKWRRLSRQANPSRHLPTCSFTLASQSRRQSVSERLAHAIFTVPLRALACCFLEFRCICAQLARRAPDFAAKFSISSFRTMMGTGASDLFRVKEPFAQLHAR